MVSLRCKHLVIKELKELNIHDVNVELGRINIIENISDSQKEYLRLKLAKAGLILIDKNKNILINNIKSVVINLIHNTDDHLKVNNSVYISNKLGLNYTYLSNFFSRYTGKTIQQFMILHKIERIKELIQYDELNFTEIARKLHYNNLAHLSCQFKKRTGETMSSYKKSNRVRELNLENL